MKTNFTKVVMKKSPIHGYGVFAQQPIKANEIIEKCYTLVTDDKDIALVDYYFKVGEKSGIALGFGCIYNHSTEPNAQFDYDTEQQLLVFKATRSIQKNEEIFISYGKDWFDCRHTKIKEISFAKKYGKYFLGTPLRGAIATAGVYLLSSLIIFILNRLEPL